jgi:hypothetical protein
LKKGEVKITVIASSFPENAQKRVVSSSLFQRENEEEKSKNKIFGNFTSSPKPEKPAEELVSAKKSEPVVVDEEDDWNAVPSFLRRSKLK